MECKRLKRKLSRLETKITKTLTRQQETLDATLAKMQQRFEDMEQKEQKFLTSDDIRDLVVETVPVAQSKEDILNFKPVEVADILNATGFEERRTSSTTQLVENLNDRMARWKRRLKASIKRGETELRAVTNILSEIERRLEKEERPNKNTLKEIQLIKTNLEDVDDLECRKVLCSRGISNQKSWKKWMKRNHPDKFQDYAKKQEQTNKVQEINSCRAELNNLEKELDCKGLQKSQRMGKTRKSQPQLGNSLTKADEKLMNELLDLQRVLNDKAMRERTLQDKLLLDAAAYQAEVREKLVAMLNKGLKGIDFFCYAEAVVDIRAERDRTRSFLASGDEYIQTLLNGVRRDYEELCLLPKEQQSVPQKRMSVIKPQLYSELVAFQNSIFVFLTKLLGKPKSFANFCADARKNLSEFALTPWQQFGGTAMAEPNMRCILSAGQTGSGKTLYALNAIKEIFLAQGNSVPTKVLVYVPVTLFSQWGAYLKGFKSKTLFPSEAIRKRVKVECRKMGGSKSLALRFSLESEGKRAFEFRVLLQAIAYTMPPPSRAWLGLSQRSYKRQCYQEPDLKSASSLLVVVDEFHKMSFTETQQATDFRGLMKGGNAAVCFYRTYLNILEFCVQIGVTFKDTRNKFLGLTATPMVFDPSNTTKTVADSLRTLLPFQSCMKSVTMLKGTSANNVKDYTRAKMKGMKRPEEFLAQEAEGFVSYVNFYDCPWHASYGTDCKQKVCMYEYENQSFRKTTIDNLLPGTNAKASPDDFVPIVIDTKIAKETKGKVKPRKPAKRTIYKRKVQVLRQFLAQKHPNASVLVYSPCTKSPPGKCLWSYIGEQLDASRNMVIFWPSESAKVQVNPKGKYLDLKAVQKRNTSNQLTPQAMSSLERKLLTALQLHGGSTGGSCKAEEILQVSQKHIDLFEDTIGAHPAMVIIGEFPQGSSSKQREIIQRYRLLQEILLKIFVKQKKQLVRAVLTQVDTGLDAAGASVLVSLEPVSAGTQATQLAGRIARVSAQPGLHGKLRAYQLVMGPSELQRVKEYYRDRTNANQLFDYYLPSVAIDRHWFGPPAVRRTSKNIRPRTKVYTLTPTIGLAVLEAVWQTIKGAQATKRKLLLGNNSRLAQQLHNNSTLNEVTKTVLDLLQMKENQKYIPLYLDLIRENEQQTVAFLKNFKPKQGPMKKSAKKQTDQLGPLPVLPVKIRPKIPKNTSQQLGFLFGFGKLQDRLAKEQKFFKQYKRFPIVNSLSSAQKFLDMIQNFSVERAFLIFLYLLLRQPNAGKFIDLAFNNLNTPQQLKASATDKVRLFFVNYRLDHVADMLEKIDTLWSSMQKDFIQELVDRCF